MKMSADEKKFTEQDMINANRVAVLQSKVADIDEEMKSVIPEIFVTLKEIRKDVAQTKLEVGATPQNITTCRDEMDKEIKKYIHDNFITKRDFILVFVSGGSVFTVVNYLITHTNFFGG